MTRSRNQNILRSSFWVLSEYGGYTMRRSGLNGLTATDLRWLASEKENGTGEPA